MTDRVLSGRVLPRAPAHTLTPPRRRWRRALAVAVTLVGLAAILSMCALAWLRTDDGHQWIARRIEDVISDQIRGNLVVGRIDALDLHHVVAHGVRFDDESGRPVIEAEDVDLSYELADLVHGRFVSYEGHVRGGRVLLETSPSGDLFVDRAFRSAHPGPPGVTEPVGVDVVHLENLDAQDITVVASLGSAPSASFSRVGALVLVRAPDHGSVIVGAEHVHGHLHVAAPMPFDLRVLAASLAVDGAAHQRVHIDMPSRIGSERIGIVMTATALPDDSLHVDARIRPHGLSGMFAAAGMITQCLVAETQSEALDVTIEMQ